MNTKFLATLVACGVVSAAFGQGVILSNLGNTGAQGDLSNGLVYNGDGTIFDGLDYNLGVNVLFSLDGNNYTLFGSYTPSTDSKGYTGLDQGQFSLGGNGASVDTGVSPGASVYIELQIWSGSGNGANALAASYAAAYGIDPTADIFFTQATSNPGANPPISPSTLTGMPSATLMVVPEPSTLALAGLGGFGMLMAFRRKKA